MRLGQRIAAFTWSSWTQISPLDSLTWHTRNVSPILSMPIGAADMLGWLRTLCPDAPHFTIVNRPGPRGKLRRLPTPPEAVILPLAFPVDDRIVGSGWKTGCTGALLIREPTPDKGSSVTDLGVGFGSATGTRSVFSRCWLYCKHHPSLQWLDEYLRSASWLSLTQTPSEFWSSSMMETVPSTGTTPIWKFYASIWHSISTVIEVV